LPNPDNTLGFGLHMPDFIRVDPLPACIIADDGATAPAAAGVPAVAPRRRRRKAADAEPAPT
jgi:hypothetical protein